VQVSNIVQTTEFERSAHKRPSDDLAKLDPAWILPIFWRIIFDLSLAHPAYRHPAYRNM
jgi:hypothetical protein